MRSQRLGAGGFGFVVVVGDLGVVGRVHAAREEGDLRRVVGPSTVRRSVVPVTVAVGIGRFVVAAFDRSGRFRSGRLLRRRLRAGGRDGHAEHQQSEEKRDAFFSIHFFISFSGVLFHFPFFIMPQKFLKCNSFRATDGVKYL